MRANLGRNAPLARGLALDRRRTKSHGRGRLLRESHTVLLGAAGDTRCENLDRLLDRFEFLGPELLARLEIRRLLRAPPTKKQVLKQSSGRTAGLGWALQLPAQLATKLAMPMPEYSDSKKRLAFSTMVKTLQITSLHFI